MASDALTEDDALVELVGDQVMALYLPMFLSLEGRTAEVMVGVAHRLVCAVDRIEGLLPVGDVVNTTARLQSHAQAGEIVLSSEIHLEAGDAIPEARPISLALKGKAHPLAAYVLAASPSA